MTTTTYFHLFQCFFYMNKDFYSRMNFNSNTLNYDLIRERIKTEKINNIVNQI